MRRTKKSIPRTLILMLWILLITLFLAVPAWATGGGSEIEKAAGPYHLTVETDPEHMTAGQTASIQVTVKNQETDQPVNDAKVIISLPVNSSNTANNDMSDDMDKMDKSDGSAPQTVTLQKQDGMSMEAGTYMADITFPQSGQINLTVSITSSLGEGMAEFPISVTKAGPNWVFIGSVASLIIVAGIIAAIIKKKNSAETGGTL
ncbi:MAG: hypothetical protein ACM3NT_07875 [Methylocystaceae bacterium]